ncbi:MAG: tetratricopeptide repeat protein [Candidatus Omnitrophota bacterium]
MMKDLYKETYVFYCHSIAMNGNSYAVHGLGGAESALTYMAQEIAKYGKEVIVFCTTDEPGMYEGVRYERLEKFLAFIQFNIIDVFISVRSVDVFFHTIKARLKVLWLHDAADQPHVAYLQNERIKRNIDCYITLSEWQKKGFVKKFKISEDKIFSSRNGVNRKFYKILRGKRRNRLVYTSTPFRGLEVLLDMFPAIRRQVPDVELYVYSSMEVYGISRQEDQERFGDIYEGCKQTGVKLIGSIPQKQLARELMKAKLFVYPNIFSETSCIAALEAQAAGLPVVASKRGALMETVVDEKTGSLIRAEDAHDTFKNEFINAVVRFLKNENLWQKCSHYARERILKKYCWDTIAREWIQFFDSKRPTLSLCIIAKDEEESIGTCIKSVQAIVDEIIVVDTGSRDNTKTIAQSFGARVYDFSWCNDFSAARNFSLAQARSDWILVLDADEVIARQDVKKIRQLLNVPDAYAYLFFQRSYLNDTTVVGWKANTGEYEEGKEYSGYFDSPLTRLFKSNCHFQFEGEVHEIVEHSIQRQKKSIINTDIPIHHFGKIKDKKKMMEKGRLYLEIGKTKIQEDPDNPRTYYDLAAQYFELECLDEAKHYYLAALQCDQEYYRALCDLGIIYVKEEKYEEALKLFDKTIAINPHYITAYTGLGLVYEALARIDDAIAIFEKAVSIDAHNVNVCKNLGLIYYKRNEYVKALECFRKVHRIDSTVNLNIEYATASYKIGMIHMEQNDLIKAKKYFEEAIKILPSYPLPYNELGIIYARQGDYDKAEAQFMRVITLIETNPNDYKKGTRAYVNLGFIYNNKGAFQKALVFLEKALEVDPLNPEIYNHIGIAKCGLGLLPDGITFFEMTLQLNPTHHAAAINLKRVKETLIQERNYNATIAKEH